MSRFRIDQPVKIRDNAALCRGAVGFVTYDNGGDTVDVSVALVGTVRVMRESLTPMHFDRSLGEYGEFVADEVTA